MHQLIPLFAAAQPATLNGLDWLMIAIYFSILFAVAWWVVRRAKDTATDYFLAGRNLGWWIIGASIFASNIVGSISLTQLPGNVLTNNESDPVSFNSSLSLPVPATVYSGAACHLPISVRAA